MQTEESENDENHKEDDQRKKQTEKTPADRQPAISRLNGCVRGLPLCEFVFLQILEYVVKGILRPKAHNPCKRIRNKEQNDRKA